MINLVSVSQALLVAEHLSFSRAAQVLGVRQSAVSRRVRALEDMLGVSLFERETTGVRLTEAGRRFLERSRPALAEIDHAIKAAASAGRGGEGVIRIGILSSVSGGFVRDLLGHYHCYNPAIALDIVEGSASEHVARITERQLDIAFVTGTPPASHCDIAVFWKARIFAALPQWHALADADGIEWIDLNLGDDQGRIVTDFKRALMEDAPESWFFDGHRIRSKKGGAQHRAQNYTSQSHASALSSVFR